MYDLRIESVALRVREVGRGPPIQPAEFEEFGRRQPLEAAAPSARKQFLEPFPSGPASAQERSLLHVKQRFALDRSLS